MDVTPSMLYSKKDIKELAQYLCENVSLPRELSDMVANHLERRDVLTIGGLSSRLHTCANAIIYRSISIDLSQMPPRISGLSKVMLLLRTLFTSKTVAKFVRNLSIENVLTLHFYDDSLIIGSNDGYARGDACLSIEIDQGCFTPNEILMYDEKIAGLQQALGPNNKIYLDRLLIALLVQAKAPKHLAIEYNYMKSSSCRGSLGPLLESSPFQNIERCRICHDLDVSRDNRIFAIPEWEFATKGLLQTEKLRDLTLCTTLKPQFMNDIRLSSITDLDLIHLQNGKFDVDSVLAAMPQLRVLSYHARVDYTWYDDLRRRKEDYHQMTGLDPLFNALHHVRSTLQRLKLSVRFLEDARLMQSYRWIVSEPPYRHRGELFSLENLYSLTIPYVSLLGWKARKVQTWDWDKFFPTSLYKITWSDNLNEHFCLEDWSDETLMPVIFSLLDWVQKHHSEEYATFKLLIGEYAEEFNKTVRDEIRQGCRIRGIEDGIVKYNQDRPKEPNWRPKERRKLREHEDGDESGADGTSRSVLAGLRRWFSFSSRPKQLFSNRKSRGD